MIACDINEDFTSIARKFWKEANVENKIKLEIAPATDTLQKLLDAGEENTFDFAFIDADKVCVEMHINPILDSKFCLIHCFLGWL